MTGEIVFGHAKIVLLDEIVDGWLAVRDGVIVEIGHGAAPRVSIDLSGDLLIPGLIELHTDHLETHLRPRPKVHWPEASAIMAFDAQIAASGITTVFDCIRAGRDDDYSPINNEISVVIGGIARAAEQGLLRAEHRVHLRCEVTSDDVIDQAEKAMAHRVNLISLMDHTPGARQFTSLDAWRTYYGGKSGRSPAELDKLIETKRASHVRNYAKHRCALVALARQRGIVLASHDDATEVHVGESIADKVAIAEFPTSAEAARLSHEAGIDVLMGAPNVVRGGSHSGNVAAEALARNGHLDILSSDYVPASLLLGAFELAHRIEDFGLPLALRTVTANPARAVGLSDRGEIAAGKRADLVRVRLVNGAPVVREVYREGQRVA
ncbi:MAG: alpha-D-ribose 1-methylphosphonate 5-triphosphate diphosphatase [Hyphomicrobiaceae bacterium]